MAKLQSIHLMSFQFFLKDFYLWQKVPKGLNSLKFAKALVELGIVVTPGQLISDEANDKVYLLEINTLPGLTRHSLVPKIANNAGFTFDKLISMILKDALR